MDEAGIILDVNPAFIHSFGYAREEIIGEKFLTLFTEKAKKKNTPMRELSAVLQNGYCTDNNYIVSKDKSLIWVTGECFLIKKERQDSRIVKIFQNKQKQKEAEDSAIMLDQFNEKILSAVDDAVILLDENLNLIEANNIFKTTFKEFLSQKGPGGFSDSSDLGSNLSGLAVRLRQAINLHQNFTNYTMEIAMPGYGKKVFDVSGNFLENIDEGGKMIIVMHDITPFDRAQKEKEDAINFVAHELRNPLANLVLFSELISEMVMENDINQLQLADLLRRNKNNIFRLNKMILGLYDTITMSSGNLQLDLSVFNFRDMVLEAVDSLHSSQKVIVKGKYDVAVTADRHRLIQVVINYLSNALKYSDDAVILDGYYDDKSITLSFTDSGMGISAEHLQVIFERFFRVQKNRHMEGIGIGLYLCKQIVEAHGGSVWAESEEGRGSVFYFSVPRL